MPAPAHIDAYHAQVKVAWWKKFSCSVSIYGIFVFFHDITESQDFFVSKTTQFLNAKHWLS